MWANTILFLCLICIARGGILSNVFGSNMVLQRAPQSASLYGWSSSGDTITVDFSSSKYLGVADAAGAWNVSLPPQQAGGPYTITISSAATPSASVNITNVLFGDVILCGGQSNMQFCVNTAFNATEALDAAGNYTTIRLFTVGQATQSSTPLSELSTIEQNWSVASFSTLGGSSSPFTYFSAVCWFTAINIQKYYPTLPLGLVSSNWGGTQIQSWSSNDALNECPQTGDVVTSNKLARTPGLYSDVELKNPESLDGGSLWNAMIVPFLQMKLTAFLWYQAEANVGQTDLYRCLFPAMIADWRAKWGIGNTPFIFAQLAPYNTDGPLPYPWSLPDMRLAQTAGLALPNVGMASTIDLGDPIDPPYTNIHPRNKQTVGYRMGLIAKSIIYGDTNIIFSGPTIDSVFVASQPPNVVVILNYLPTTIGDGLVLLPATCPEVINATYCLNTWEIGLSDGSWHNATAAVVKNVAVQLTLPPLSAGVQVAAVRYLYSDWPVAPLYSNSTGLPASPFYVLTA